MSVLGIAAIMQPLLGRILDFHWQGVLLNGARIYNHTAYSPAVVWFLVSAALSVVMVYFTRESHCRILEACGFFLKSQRFPSFSAARRGHANSPAW